MLGANEPIKCNKEKLEDLKEIKKKDGRIITVGRKQDYGRITNSKTSRVLKERRMN